MSETWLTPYKEMFVAAWTNIVTHLGNTTTNKYMDVSRSYYITKHNLEYISIYGFREESAHWRLKNMLTTSREDLCRS